MRSKIPRTEKGSNVGVSITEIIRIAIPTVTRIRIGMEIVAAEKKGAIRNIADKRIEISIKFETKFRRSDCSSTITD
jgi:hypothetical protein